MDVDVIEKDRENLISDELFCGTKNFLIFFKKNRIFKALWVCP
jgi:hypothetical protein